jgi:DNA-binding transcriptional MerR regulator
MAADKKLYSIGEMARICNVTTKLLRYYDANHIVSPEYKDTRTNYRYYTEKQLAAILFVKELKKLDFSLQDIASLLNDRELLLMQKKLHTRLERARAELSQAREYYDQTVDTLLRVNDILQLKGVRSVPEEEIKEVQLVEMPVYQVVSSRHPSYWNADTIFIDRRAELYKLIEDNDLQTFGSVMAVFHGNYLKQFSHKPEDLVGDLEVCMQVREAKGCTQIRKLGGCPAVSTVHVGHYRYMRPVYLHLQRWAREHGYRLADYSIEEYLCGVTMTSIPEEFVTRIYLPLVGK